MAARSISEMKRVRYLLGLSTPAEREHIESEYFADEDAFQEMLTAEDDLIDAYAGSELAGEERRRFEKSFVSSLRGRDRVQFARAFADTVSATRSIEAKLPSTLLRIFKTFQSVGLLRTAAVATVIVFVAVLAWLVIDRGKMTNELRELRVEFAELSKRTEALKQSSDTEGKHTEIERKLADAPAQPDKPRHRERWTTATQRARHLPEVKNAREKIASSKPEQAEKLTNTQDAALGNAFETKITELPIQGRNVTNLLSLQPATPRDGQVAGGRADQANITLDGLNTGSPFNTYSLLPRSGETTITIPSYFSWIRFHITLETAAIHEDYRVIIKTADGRHITSVNWIEPLTPNQTVIHTPVISTGDLSSGDYLLLLVGKEPDGSFVKVAEHSFNVIKY